MKEQASNIMGKVWAALENGKAAAPLRVAIIIVGSMLTLFIGYVGWSGGQALDVIKDKFGKLDDKITYVSRNMVTKTEFQHHTDYIFGKIDKYDLHCAVDEMRWEIFDVIEEVKK